MVTASVWDRLTDAVYGKFGLPATYSPPGDEATTCTVQVVRSGSAIGTDPYTPITFSGSGLHVAIVEIDVLVRKSEIELPEAGGAFVVYTDETMSERMALFRIGQDPIDYDADGREWRCSCSSADA